MELYILNGLNGIQDTVNGFKSTIINTEFYGLNDFEIVVPATAANINLFAIGKYIVRKEDISGSGASLTYKNVMMIEKVNITIDEDAGRLLTVSGSGIKKLLGRRVIWYAINYSGTVEGLIRQVINENIIVPQDPARVYPNIELAPAIGDTQTIDAQLFGQNIADWLTEICRQFKLGWDLYISGGKYVFELYKGTDRTYGQDDVVPVVFSPDLDNLNASSYDYDLSGAANAAIVSGDGEGSVMKSVAIGTATGEARREMYVDASELSSNYDDLTTQEYYDELRAYGYAALSQQQQIETFSGDIVPDGIYKINKDYFLGDYVEIINDLGISAVCQITEIIDAEDETGRTIIPTFNGQEDD